MYISISAITYSVLIGITILFQLALAAGMPWGSYAMGGKFPGKLPKPMRVAALFQIILLALFALIVLSKSNMMLPEWYPFAKTAIWGVVLFSVIATALNLMTTSRGERMIWAPVSVLLLLTSLIVAFGS